MAIFNKKSLAILGVAASLLVLAPQQSNADAGVTLGIIGTTLGATSLGLQAVNTFGRRGYGFNGFNRPFNRGYYNRGFGNRGFYGAGGPVVINNYPGARRHPCGRRAAFNSYSGFGAGGYYW